jgi:hypothetical protein
MKLLHIALVNSSEKNSDLFYKNLLGCEKKPPRRVPAALMKSLFNLDEVTTIINYVHKDGLVFEVFIMGVRELTPVSHACLTVKDLDGFLNTCKKMNIPIRCFEKDDGGSIVFIEDYDNNLFEIKET